MFAATANTFWVDAQNPQPTRVFYYLVRANAPWVGAWGQASDGTPTNIPCD